MTVGGVSLALARTMQSARTGRVEPQTFEAVAGPAQAGALFRLAEHGFVDLHGPAKAQNDAVASLISRSFAAGAPGAGLIGRQIANQAQLERAAATWFAPDARPEDAAAAGYWLADIFLRRTSRAEIVPLVRFLIGRSGITPPRGRRCSVRRYPTGGISEKQALILPAMLRALAEAMDWCSPFLIARRLAHTGGTLDKLGVLPGFKPAPAKMLAEWTGHDRTVVYAAAGPELCPRDAAMYRMRGETGTVPDVGLMAASILAKQAAAPVDVLALDILHGPTAFLQSAEDAESFARLCVSVGHELGLSVTPLIRTAVGPMGLSIGASTELAEAAELLDPRRGADVGSGELARAIAFTEALAGGAGRDPQLARRLATEALVSGRAHENLLALWRDHGVREDFLEAVRRDAREALLSDLHRIDVRADTNGFLRWDWPALAAMVNERVNGFRAAGDGPPRLDRGGVEVHKVSDGSVTCGDLLLTAFLVEPQDDLVDGFSGAFTISSN